MHDNNKAIKRKTSVVALTVLMLTIPLSLTHIIGETLFVKQNILKICTPQWWSICAH